MRYDYMIMTGDNENYKDDDHSSTWNIVYDTTLVTNVTENLTITIIIIIINTIYNTTTTTNNNNNNKTLNQNVFTIPNGFMIK